MGASDASGECSIGRLASQRESVYTKGSALRLYCDAWPLTNRLRATRLRVRL
jgi:hypothetical protein